MDLMNIGLNQEVKNAAFWFVLMMPLAV